MSEEEKKVLTDMGMPRFDEDEPALENLTDAEIDAEVTDDGLIPEPDEDERELAREIIRECEIIDESGESNCAVACNLCAINDKGEKVKTLGDCTVNEPYIRFNMRYPYTGEGYIEVSMIFNKARNPKLVQVHHLLKSFAAVSDTYHKDERLEDNEIPVIVFNFIPLSMTGVAYVTANSPIFWSVEPHNEGEEADTVKLLFRSDDVHFVMTDEIKLKEITDAAAREAYEAAEAEREQAEAEAAEEQRKIAMMMPKFRPKNGSGK